jgi:hypothetical protein
MTILSNIDTVNNEPPPRKVTFMKAASVLRRLLAGTATRATLAVALALLVTAVLILISGKNPLLAYAALL